MEILNKILDVINDMNMYLKAFILVVLMCAVLGYTYLTKEEVSAPEPTVQKEVRVGDIQGGVQGGFQITQ